ncbi:MAG TPA: sodium/solute symporter [Elusimicrobiota bacterium]|nr:sodium/solute symporter [Elusimicrobiota bacterium]
MTRLGQFWFPGPFRLGQSDLFILTGLIAILIALNYALGSRSRSTEDFFLARRQIPWWVAVLSFVATEVSAVTIISVPAVAYKENWEYAQFFIGSALARIVIAYMFIPAFYYYNCVTIYEFLMHRFGAATQRAATVFFYVTRLLGSGVRLMAASLAMSVLFGWHILPTIILFATISLTYILYGGIKAVVWTGVFQTSMFIVGGLASITYLVLHIHGGWHAVFQIAGAAGRLQFWNWGPHGNSPDFWRDFFRDPNIVYIAVLNGFFGSMAAFGTDQELMQRLLTVETRRQSQKSMVSTPLASGLVLVIYLTVGSCLYVFYAQNPALPIPAKFDAIFPHFIAHVMPSFLRGLLLAVVVLASIESPVVSLTASFVTDIYKPLINDHADEAYYLKLSRRCVAVFALILILIAYTFSHFQNILWLAFKIGGVTFGSLLGVFLLGFLTTRRSNRANVWGMTIMAAANAVLLTLSETHLAPIGWTWLLLIGTAGTFGIGYIWGPRMDPSPAHSADFRPLL